MSPKRLHKDRECLAACEARRQAPGARRSFEFLMEIALNIPRGPRQREFLDYLNSALRQRTASYTGSAGLNKEGLFESTVTGPFPVDQSLIQMTWRLTKDPEGTLMKLSIESADPQVTENTWKTAVYEFVTSVLATTLAEKRQEFFRRSFFFYIGPQLDGEYWLPGYRFAPAYPADPQPYLVNAERVVSIDQEVNAIDHNHAIVLAEEAARRHAARLSLLLNTGLYSAEHVLRWVWPAVEGKPVTESARFHLGFSHPSLNLAQMPKKGEQCPLGSYKGSLAARYRVAGELLSLPPEARRILRSVDTAAPFVTDAFDRGARLYQVAGVCGSLFPSVGLAYRVAAVEAISKADPECSSFSEFMRKHVTSRKDTEWVLNYLYRLARSAHFHAGEFPLGEFSRVFYFDPLMDSDSIQRDELHRTCYELTREAIVNWLTKMIPEIDEERGQISSHAEHFSGD